MRDGAGSLLRFGLLRLVDWSGGEPEHLQQFKGEAGEVSYTGNSPSTSNSVRLDTGHGEEEEKKPRAKILRRRILPCTLTDRDATLNASISGGSGPALCQFQQQLKHLSGEGGGISPKPWIDYCVRKKGSRGEGKRLENTKAWCTRELSAQSKSPRGTRGGSLNDVEGGAVKGEEGVLVGGEGRGDSAGHSLGSPLRVEDRGIKEARNQHPKGEGEGSAGQGGRGGSNCSRPGNDHCLPHQDAPALQNGTAGLLQGGRDSSCAPALNQKSLSGHDTVGGYSTGASRSADGVDGEECSRGSTQWRQGERGEAGRTASARRVGGSLSSDEEKKEEEAEEEEEEVTEVNFVRRFLAVSAAPADLPSCPSLSAAQGEGVSLLLGGARGTVGVCEGGRFRWEVKIVDIVRNGLDGGGGAVEFSSAARLGSEGGRALSLLSPSQHAGGGNSMSSSDCAPPPVREGSSASGNSEHQSTGGETASVGTNPMGTSSILPSHRPVFPFSSACSFQRVSEGLVRVGFCTAEDSLFLGDSVTSLGLDSDGYVLHGGEVARQEASTDDASRGSGVWDASSAAKTANGYASSNYGQALPPFLHSQQDGIGGEGETGGGNYFPANGGEVGQGGGQETVSSCPPTASLSFPGPPSLPGGTFFAKESRLCRPYFRAGDVLTIVLNMRKEELREDGLCNACHGVLVPRGDAPDKRREGSKVGQQPEKKETEKAQSGGGGAEGADEDKKKKRRKKRGGGGHAYYTIDDTGGTIEKQGDVKKETDKGDANNSAKAKKKAACSCWSVSFFCNGERVLAPLKLPEECRGKVLFPCINLR